jgi:CheY-like chemotaxis protein
MLHAPTDLHCSQPLLQDADRLMATADALLAPSCVLIACGKARAEARAADAVTSEEPPAREEGAMAPQTPLTILLIDDEPSFVSALAQLLRHDGHTVDTAADGHCALRHLHEHRYDLVLCDLRMPGLDGGAFYDVLSQQHAYLRKRVLFLTGDTLGADSQAFLEQCGQPWVYKPCKAAAIRTAIQQMLHAVEDAG